jgi:hypothetical protein
MDLTCPLALIIILLAVGVVFWVLPSYIGRSGPWR